MGTIAEPLQLGVVLKPFDNERGEEIVKHVCQLLQIPESRNQAVSLAQLNRHHLLLLLLLWLLAGEVGLEPTRLPIQSRANLPVLPFPTGCVRGRAVNTGRDMDGMSGSGPTGRALSVEGQGLEPRSREPKSRVLPLDDPSRTPARCRAWSGRRDSNPH